MNNELALHALCKEMLVAYNKYVREYYHEPKMRVSFSPNGYNEVRACADAMIRFSNTRGQKINGYPFSIERYQKEDYVVHVDGPRARNLNFKLSR